MRKLILVVVLSLTVGCASFSPSENAYLNKKEDLERNIEILKLKKRKRILELQIETLDQKELEELKKEKKWH